MSEHTVTIDWKRETPDFAYETYNRDHDWTFDAGIQVRASASPAYVGNASCVDPEEAFVASLSSCHMLRSGARLQEAVRRGQLSGSGGRGPGQGCGGEHGHNKVTLRPEVSFGGEKVPSAEEVRQLHEHAHHVCFIANSVKTEVVVEPLVKAG